MITDGHLKGAKEFVDECIEDGFGEQPVCIVYDDGEIISQDRTAVCASGMFNCELDMKRNPMWWQTVITNERTEGQKGIYIVDDLIFKYLKYITTDSFISRYIPKHSPDIWLTHGVPIRLVDVKRSVPLLCSTHIRDMWDRHNSVQVAAFIYWRKLFPRMRMSKITLLSNILSGMSEGIEECSVYLFSGVHALMGKEVSVAQAKNYLLKKDVFDLCNNDKFIGEDRGGVAGTFSRGKGNLEKLLEDIAATLPTAHKPRRYALWKPEDNKLMAKKTLEAILNA